MPRAKTQEAQRPNVNVSVEMPQTPAAQETVQPQEKPFFWGRLNAIPAEKWEKDVELWIYRVEPKVRMAPGERGYLDILTQPITPMYVKKRWGGGRFRFMVLDKGKLLYSAEEEIEGDPIYDKRREVAPAETAAPGNGAGGAIAADFQREFISVLREELARSRESNQGGTQGTDEVVKMLTSASEKAMEIVTKQTPQASNPTQQLTELVTTAKNLGLIGNTGGGNDMMTTLLVPLLKTMMERMLTPSDPLEQITKLGAVFDVLDRFRGGGEGTPKDWKAMLVSQGLQHVPELINAFREGTASTTEQARLRAIESQNRARAAEVLDAQRRGVAPPSGLQPAAQVQPIRPQPVVVASRAPAIRIDGGLQTEALNAQPGAAAQEMPLDEAAQRAQYDETMKVQVVNLLRMGCSGETIADFLYDVKPEFCAELAKYTPEMITAFFANDPILKLAVEDPRWQEVLNEAHDYIVETEAEEAKEAAPA